MIGISGIPIEEDFGYIKNPGQWNNLPAGEVFLNKVNWAYGKFLCNLTTGLGEPPHPIMLNINEGKLEGEIGNWGLETEDSEFKRLLLADLNNPDYGTERIIGELGFGINYLVKNLTGNMSSFFISSANNNDDSNPPEAIGIIKSISSVDKISETSSVVDEIEYSS